MASRTLASKLVPLTRSFTTSAVRNGHHDTRGVVGSNLPFNIDNPYRLFITFTLYFGSGLGLPFLTLRYMIKAKNQG